MAEALRWQGQARMAVVQDHPIKALNHSLRGLIGRSLDVHQESFSEQGLQKDWVGLAELIGFDSDQIQCLREKPERTVYLIEQWSHHPHSTIGQFIDALEKLERFDILENEVIQKRILSDVESYVRHQKRLNEDPVQSPEIDSSVNSVGYSSDCPEEEYRNITVGEVETGRPELFDAFVCYSSDDLGFVKHMMDILENKHNFKLCIKDRDLILGCATDAVITFLIKNRCKKMIIILSRKFTRCPQCDFMTKFGHSLAPGARTKKLIPIVIEQPCEIPDILRYIAHVDYTKCELVEWFWWRVAKSLEESPHSRAVVDASASKMLTLKTAEEDNPTTTDHSTHSVVRGSDTECSDAEECTECSILAKDQDQQDTVVTIKQVTNESFLHGDKSMNELNKNSISSESNPLAARSSPITESLNDSCETDSSTSLDPRRRFFPDKKNKDKKIKKKKNADENKSRTFAFF